MEKRSIKRNEALLCLLPSNARVQKQNKPKTNQSTDHEALRSVVQRRAGTRGSALLCRALVVAASIAGGGVDRDVCRQVANVGVAVEIKKIQVNCVNFWRSQSSQITGCFFF